MRHLQCTLFAAVAVIGFTSVASATDMPVRAPAVMPVKAPVVAPLPVYSWTGWYLGDNFGWIGSRNSVTLTGTDTGAGGIGRPLGLPPGALDVGGNKSGIIGGLQLGYNWQSASWLWGLETDFVGASINNSSTFGNTVTGFVPVTYGVETRLQYLGTLRARAGYLLSPTLLTYGTGGLAYGKHKLSLSAVCPTCAPPANLFSESSKWNAGWTVGGGVEWMFAPQWSLKAEYLYVDLGNLDTTINYAYGANTSSVTGTIHDRDHILRAGINYHF